MEKLQPILKHKFWIISGIALLVPIIGWFMDRGAIAERIQQRWDTLSKLAPPSGANTPNQSYIDGIQFVNKSMAERQKELERVLYDEQKQLWFWPAEVADRMQDKSYRDRVSNSILQDYRFAYTDHFVKDVVEATIRPYKVSYTGEETGLVKVDGGTGNFGGGGMGRMGGREMMPGGAGGGLGFGNNWFPSSIQHIDAKSRWATEPPTPKEMWDAQEDLWLIQQLLEAVADVNDGARRVSDAPIREIHTLFLRGGSRPDPNALAATAGGMGGMGGMPEGGGYGGGGGGGLGGVFGQRSPGGREGMGMGGMQSADFSSELDAVFGSDAPIAAASMGGDMEGSPGGGGGHGGGGGMMPGGYGGGGIMPGGGGREGAGGLENRRRYVDDSPDLPYKTRGFYLHVTMLHSDLPRLQAALVSRGWPVTLLRVQYVSKHHDFQGMDTNSTGRGRGRMGFEGPGGGGGIPMRRRPRSFTPMGGGYGEGPMGGLPGGPGGTAGPGGVVLTPGIEEQQTLWDAAMEDPYLADVAIAGLMTLYSSPDIDEEAIQEAEAEDVAKQQAAQQNATPDQTPPGEGETPMPADGAPMPPGQEQPNGINPNPGTGDETTPQNGLQSGQPSPVSGGNPPNPANPLANPNGTAGNPTPGTPDGNTPPAAVPPTENPPAADPAGNP